MFSKPRKMSATHWSVTSSNLLREKFKGKASQWKSKNLKSVRAELRAEVLKLQGYRCAYCMRIIGAEIGRHEIDHVLPCSKYPQFTYTKYNLVATCKRCNWLKKDLDPRFVLRFIKKYPVAPDVWKWVHPYIHEYNDHIEILGGLIFSPRVTSGLFYKRAKHLIDTCHLDKLQIVEKRAIYELACACQDANSAATNLAAFYPAIDAKELARKIVEAHPNVENEHYFEKLIGGIRLATTSAVLNAMRASKTKI